MERYFPEPYRFIPPYRSTLWCRLSRRMILRNLRKNQGVVRWHFTGQEELGKSLDKGAGILLAPNHCRWADPPLLGILGDQFHRYFYYVASIHLFLQKRLRGWLLNRIGCYSIWREGIDRESIKTTASILATAERPVVLFPEGTWFRQNDRVMPLQEGLSLITRQAARQTDRPLVVHPVGIKYWVLEDPMPAIDSVLTRIERQLGWHPQGNGDVLARIEKLGSALVAIKEIEYLGNASQGDLDGRMRALVQSLLGRIENEYLDKTHDGWPLERIRRLRQVLMRQLHDRSGKMTEVAAIRKALEDLLLCENLEAQSMDYLREAPGFERLTETVQRIEETISDREEKPLVPMGATLEVGPAIDVRAFAQEKRTRNQEDPLMLYLRERIQGLVDRLIQRGPPPEWNCPQRRLEPGASGRNGTTMYQFTGKPLG